MNKLRRKLSYANVVATLALVFAMTGGAFAAKHYIISSSTQIKPGAISASRLSKSARESLQGQTGKTGPAGVAGPNGPPGPAGAPGGTGPIGPSNGYSTGFTDSNQVALEADGTQHTLMSLTVPTGSYVVTARLQGLTVAGGSVGQTYRYDCALYGGAGFTNIDTWTARVGSATGVESYLPFDGGYTGAGPIFLVCSAGNQRPLQALSGSLVATKVGGLN
jgi:hypothetical protein